jgi:hypothetical protein
MNALELLLDSLSSAGAWRMAPLRNCSRIARENCRGWLIRLLQHANYEDQVEYGIAVVFHHSCADGLT